MITAELSIYSYYCMINEHRNRHRYCVVNSTGVR